MADESGNSPTTVNKYALSCAIVASVISIIFGYDTGVMSGATIFIKDDLSINDTQVEILMGILNICALFGSLLAGKTSDIIGRRYTIAIASTIFLVGSVLMGYGPNYAILMTGRCIAGIGVGFTLMIAPVYSTEISSPASRGLLSSLPEVCISVGLLLGYISNYLFSKLTLKLGWRLMLGIAAIPSLVLAFGVLQMPESPRWLILQGRLGEAKTILYKVTNTKEEAETRFRDIKVAAGISPDCNEQVVKIPQQSHGKGVWKELLLRPTPAVRRILTAAIGIHFFEHTTGIEAIVLYSPRIFRKAGIASKNKLLLATVGMGVVRLIFITISATLLIDRFGRRKLLSISVGGMIVALSGLGFALTFIEQSKSQPLWAIAMSIATCYLFIVFFVTGLGPITWVYSSEIFPLRLRAQGYSIGVAVNRLMNAAVSMSFISIYKAITIGGAFFMFAGVAVVAWFFFYFMCPETKGRSLEDIEEIFSEMGKGRSVGMKMLPGSSNNIEVKR